MGIAVTVQVKTGQEQKVADWFNHFRNLFSEVAAWTKKAYAFVEEKQKLLKNGKLGKSSGKAAFSGYLFVELHCKEQTNLIQFPDAVYQLLKSIPNVISIFSDEGQLIDEDKFQNMKKQFNVQPVAEIEVPMEDEQLKVLAAVEQYNVATSPKQKQEAETTLVAIEQEKTVVEQVNEFDVSARRSLKQVKAFLRSKTQVIQLPIKLFTKLHTSISRLPESAYAIPYSERVIRLLLKHLKGVMQRR